MRLNHLLRSVLIAIALACSMQVFAELSLDSAKAQGLVGEDSSGYLAAVDTAPSREVRTLINEINGKRREEYERIADSNNIEVSAVEQLAGKKAIQRTEPGGYIRIAGGAWQRK